MTLIKRYPAYAMLIGGGLLAGLAILAFVIAFPAHDEAKNQEVGLRRPVSRPYPGLLPAPLTKDDVKNYCSRAHCSTTDMVEIPSTQVNGWDINHNAVLYSGDKPMEFCVPDKVVPRNPDPNLVLEYDIFDASKPYHGTGEILKNPTRGHPCFTAKRIVFSAWTASRIPPDKTLAPAYFDIDNVRRFFEHGSVSLGLANNEVVVAIPENSNPFQEGQDIEIPPDFGLKARSNTVVLEFDVELGGFVDEPKHGYLKMGQGAKLHGVQKMTFRLWDTNTYGAPIPAPVGQK